MRRLSTFLDLIKYKLSLAVTFSAVTGYTICDSSLSQSLFFLITGVFLLAAGSAALNQYTESESDALMDRTMNRPIPGYRIIRENALLISVILLVFGFFLLLITGFIPALLGTLTVILYNFVYTKLKKISFLAVVSGAFVGAIPPVIGFTSAGGTLPGNEILMFSLFMFIWQLPHFWLIIIRYRNDYMVAGFKTFPGNLSIKQVRILVFLWVVLSTFLLIGLSSTGIVFSKSLNLVIIPLNIVFISFFYVFLFRVDEKNSVRDAFILINSFSLAMMILFIVNSFLN